MTITHCDSAMSNPRISDEGKERARKKLEEMGGEPNFAQEAGKSKDPGNFARGLKA
jgi:Conidiation protein 6